MRTRLGSFCACALVVAVLTACGGLQPEDPAQALREGGSAVAKLKTVSATLKLTKGTISFIGFTLVNAKASVRLPSESDTVYTVRQKDVQFAVEVIITGNRVFLHIPFTATTELTGPSATTVPDLAKLFDGKTGLPAVIPAGASPKYLGAEQVDGVDSHKVEATYSASQVHSMLPQLNSSGEVDAVIWIGGSDHLIRKAVLSGLFGDNGTASSVEVDLSAFNGAVTIASPLASAAS